MLALGISAYYHDSAAALVRDGEIVAAAQEERFSRRKFDEGFPVHAIRHCLDAAGVELDAVDLVGFYDKPLLTFDRLLETYLSFAPAGFVSFTAAMPSWLKQKLMLRREIAQGLAAVERGTFDRDRLRFGFHHHSHAASAFYPSPYDSAAILVMDGVGEWATSSIGVGRGTKVELLRELRFPHSIGLLYAAFTYHLGFRVNDGEYKVMGLAPYGRPRFADRIREVLIDLKDDGSFRMDQSFFDYCTGLRMTNDRFAQAFELPRREEGAPLHQDHMDLAASLQSVTEDIVLRLARTARELTGEARLCLAGGVALNCVANGKLERERIFDEIWIQPAAGDAGGALGVALALAYAEDGVERQPDGHRDSMRGTRIGPAFDAVAVRAALDAREAPYEELDDDALFARTADALAEGKVVGWFQGGMEFGPRALGNRSILADPRRPDMQSRLNLSIKYREGFRPFAPAVLSDRAREFFELDVASPYMLLVAPVAREHRRTLDEHERAAEGFDRLRVARSDIPAVTHVDDSARVQTVDAESHPRFHRLLAAFAERSGCPVLVNTSFNVRDEPIVCTPDDAYRCFMGTEMDMLVLENFVVRKDML